MSIRAMPVNPEYTWGHNASGSTIAAFLCVQGGRTSIALAAGITAVPFGITAEAILNGERGDIANDGEIIGTAGTGGVTQGQRLMPEAGATGKLVPWSAGAGANATVVGECMQTAAADETFTLKWGVGAIGQGA